MGDSHTTTSWTRPLAGLRVSLADIAERLRELAGSNTPVLLRGAGGVEVTGLTLSTARVEHGDLFAAMPGMTSHGALHVDQALEAGAVAVLTDPEGSVFVPETVPTVVVEGPRRFLGELAASLYDRPAATMQMLGVTGTQGKTTVTQLAEGALSRAGTTAAVIGTVGTRVAGHDVATSLTTPEAPDLQALFARMREASVRACAMEVSSHALALGRVDGIVFDVATFLNLGRDHLDFHADVEEYYSVKASLFTPARARSALVNVDDEHGRRLMGETRLPVSTFSAAGQDADWRAVDVVAGPEGSTFRLLGPDGVDVATSVPLPGDFNVANALAAVATCALAGFDPVEIARGISEGPGVPGRLERVAAGQDFTVVVDYAHKPDAVEATLRTLRPLTAGRLMVVLGAGGDRDRGKRPVMGEIAARLADVVVVTDDNPRSEDPALIRAALLEGARTGDAEVVEIGDRRAAIAEALHRAGPGDVVLVAGKGHETGQEVAGVVTPFDDREVVREGLAAL